MGIRSNYIGRFAPSPTGPLHQGSLVAAMASYLDARAHGGDWLVRIEDVDEGRSVPGAAENILALLRTLGMDWDGEVVWQSRRKALYQAAADQIRAHTYPCGCNRREIADSRLGTAPDGSAIYPGTCRNGLGPGKTMRSLRVRVPDAAGDAGTDGAAGSERNPSSADSAGSPDNAGPGGFAGTVNNAGSSSFVGTPNNVGFFSFAGTANNAGFSSFAGTANNAGFSSFTGTANSAVSHSCTARSTDLIAFTDRIAGPVAQHLATESGDFVLKRADGFWAYQLAVVVDDAQQGVTDVVRGADLIDSTPRQIYLQQLLGVPTPRYLHVPVVRNAQGEKLSKQTGALAVAPDDDRQAIAALHTAAAFLQLPLALSQTNSVSAFWQAAIPAWAKLIGLSSSAR